MPLHYHPRPTERYFPERIENHCYLFLYHIYVRKSNNSLTFLTKEQIIRYTEYKNGGRHATLALEPTLFCQHPGTHFNVVAARRPYCGRTSSNTQPDG